MNEYVTIKEHVEYSVIEKKSKFITNLFAVQNQDEVEKFLKEINEKYSDATHNCYAYTYVENSIPMSKASDDGEPSGTAGVPMLNVILQNNLQNILTIVTRYYGGIQLGAGGLVRAYSGSVSSALKNSKLITLGIGYQVKIILDYDEFDKLKYFFEKNNVEIVKVNYLNDIECVINIEKEKFEMLKEKTYKAYNMTIVNHIYVEKCK